MNHQARQEMRNHRDTEGRNQKPGESKTQNPESKIGDSGASLADLVWSLSAATLTYLGRGIAPGQEKPAVNLKYARHTIATLEMIKAKTGGNRTEEESKLLDEMLYELRLAYVKAEEDQKSAAKPTDPGPA